jgi:hypothetical protein
MIFFFLSIVVVLALAPTINTANNTAFATLNATTGAGNATNIIGLSAVMPFGAPLIILSLMVSFGLLAFTMKEGATVGSIVTPIGIMIAQIIGLTLFSNVITYTSTLMAGTTGIALVIYGIIPLAIYLGIIGSAGGYTAYKAYRGRKGGKSKSYSGANY